MPPNESLTALVEIRDRVSRSLDDIARRMEEVADTSREAATATSLAAEAFDEAQDEGSALDRAMESLQGSSADASGSLGTTATTADQAGDAFDSAARDSRGLARRLDSVAENAREAATSLTAMRGAAAGIDIDADVDRTATTHVDVTGVSQAGTRLAAIRGAIESLDGETATLNVETSGIGRALARLNSLGDVGIETAEASARTAIDTTGADRARATIASVRATLATLDRTTAVPTVRTAGTALAISQLEAVGQIADALDETTATVRSRVQGTTETPGDLGEQSAEAITEVDTEGAQTARQSLERVQESARAVSRTPARAHIDSEGYGDTLAELGAIRAAAARADAQDVDIEADANVHMAMGAMALPGLTERLGDLRNRVPELDIETNANIRASVGRLEFPGLTERLGEVRERVSDIDIGGSIDADLDGGVDEETLASFHGIADAIRDIPDLSFDADIDTPDQLVTTLSEATEEGIEAAESLGTLGEAGDEFVDAADSLPELMGSLSEADIDTRPFESLSETSRDLVDDALAGAASVDQLAEQTDDAGTSALAAAAELDAYEGQLSDVTGEAITSAVSMHGLADEIDDVGDEGLKSAAQIGALGTAMEGLGLSKLTANLGVVSGRMTTLLKIIAPLIPMIGSLTVALGGLGTAAVGAGGALAGIFAGGLLNQGERLAETSSKIQEELQDSGDELASMPSDMEEAAAGAEEIMSRFRESAFEAMEPLRTAEFSQFTMGVLEGAIELLRDFSTAAARLSGPLFEMTDAIGSVFWEQEPEIIASLMSLTRSLLPIIEDLMVYLIRALPGAFSAMEDAGTSVLPMLGDFFAALMDIMGPVVRIGSAMFAVLLPALMAVMPFFEGLAEGAAMVLVPALTALGGLLTTLGDLFGGVLGPIAETVGMFLGAAAAASALISVGSALAGVLTTAMVPALTMLGKAMWASLGPWGIAIGAIVTLIDLFDLWEPIIATAKAAWNGLMDTITEYSSGIFDWVEDATNTLIGAINKLIRIANKLPRVDLGEVEQIELSDQGVDASGMKVGQGNQDAETPTPENGASGGMGGGGQSQFAQDQQAVAGNNIDTMNVTVQGDGDSDRIKAAVRDGLEEANREQRRRTSPVN